MLPVCCIAKLLVCIFCLSVCLYLFALYSLCVFQSVCLYVVYFFVDGHEDFLIILLNLIPCRRCRGQVYIKQLFHYNNILSFAVEHAGIFQKTLLNI